MNRKPNTTGIDKRWKPGDERIRLARILTRITGDEVKRDAVDAFLDAFRRLVWGRKRTVIVGFGVFEWKRWKNRIPTGEIIETWRLVFKPARCNRKRKWK